MPSIKAQVARLADVATTEEEAQRIVDAAKGGVCTIIVSFPLGRVSGSGFQVDRGLITAKHVIAPSLIEGTGSVMPGTFIEYQPLTTPTRFQTKLEGIIEQYDLAILAKGDHLDELPWGDSDALKKGDEVIVLAQPATITNPNLEIYASVGRIEEIYSTTPALFTYRVPVQPGSSGGAVLNLNGEVVGINLLQEREGDVVLGSGIKSNTIKAVLEGAKPPEVQPILIPEGLTWVDVTLGAAVMAFGVVIISSGLEMIGSWLRPRARTRRRYAPEFAGLVPR